MKNKSPGDYDCYSILGITYNADVDEIRRAYRRLALQYHPDRNKSQEAAAIFGVVQMAYDTLMDAGKRRKYDSTISALTNVSQAKIKLLLSGAYTEGFVMDDRASINLVGSDETIVFENSITIPTVWINKSDEYKQYPLYTDNAFERLFRALFATMNPKERLDDLWIMGTPELRAHFDARFWNRGQTNVSVYCYSSMTFTIINGLPHFYLQGAKYHNAECEIGVEFFGKMKDAILDIIRAELVGETIEPPPELVEPKTLFQPIKHISELRLPPQEVCNTFVRISRIRSPDSAVQMLSKVYGVPPMKVVFQHRFPINDMVCRNALAVYYSDDMTSYLKPEGVSMRTILHEFYHHLVYCYGVRDMLDYQIIPDPVTGYYARNEREERAADSFAQTFIRRIST